MIKVSSINQAEYQEGRMPETGNGQNRMNDSVTKELQTKLQGEEQKLKDLSYREGMSAEEKSKKRQEIRQEISELNRELRQHQLELQRERQQKAKETEKENRKEAIKEQITPKEESITGQNPPDREKNNGRQTMEEEREESKVSRVRMDALLTAESGVAKANVRTKVAANIEQQIDVLEVEIKQDKMRGQDVKLKEQEKEELEDIIIRAKSSGIGTLQEVNKELDEVAKDGYKDEKRNAVDVVQLQKEQWEHVRVSIH